MTYGNTSTLYFVAARGRELKYDAPAFLSENDAIEYARGECGRDSEFAIYRAELAGFLVMDAPRWIPSDPQRRPIQGEAE